MSSSETADTGELRLSAAGLVAQIERLAQAELHEPPFGVIRHCDEENRCTTRAGEQSRGSGDQVSARFLTAAGQRFA